MQTNPVVVFAFLCAGHLTAFAQMKSPLAQHQDDPRMEVKTAVLFNGVQLNYADRGDKTGDPAIFLIGTFLSFSNKPGTNELGSFINQLTDPVDSMFIYNFQKSNPANAIPAAQLNTYVTRSMKLPAHVWPSVMTGLLNVGYEKDMKTSATPALLVWGGKDALPPSFDQDMPHNDIKNSTLGIYSNTGPAVHRAKPVLFASDRQHFLNKFL